MCHNELKELAACNILRDQVNVPRLLNHLKQVDHMWMLDVL